MTKAKKAGAIVFGMNMLFIILLVVNQSSEGNFITIGIFWLFSLFLQVVAGLILVIQKSRREWGQGVLLGALLGLLIGFSVCSVALR
jgi:hypothetical protein